MQTTIPLIQLDNIEKVFLTDEVETHALSGVQLEIRHGDYVSISGPSGCGKSTLLSILGLLDSPTNGSYQLRGEPVEDYRRVKAFVTTNATVAVPEEVVVLGLSFALTPVFCHVYSNVVVRLVTPVA